ncbi:MAG: Ig-like domain-containing protein [Thiolinea sp.]
MSSEHDEIKVNTLETINLIWTRNGMPQGTNHSYYGHAWRISSSVKTDVSGNASFTLKSATAGGTVVTATDAETGLSVSLVKEFVATVPANLSVQSEQSHVSPEGQTTIFALVRDADDNPVKNQKVSWVLRDTVNGRLSSSLATTDSLGRATVVYTAGNASSAKDGVVIEATLQNNPTITDRLTLTVGDRAMRIVLGFDENMTEDGIYYKKSYGVVVTDSAGNPVANQSVHFDLIPTHYYKGLMTCQSESWQPSLPPRCPDGTMDCTEDEIFYPVPTQCPAEDVNMNGWLDNGEDANNNAQLDPTNTATVTTKVQTDAEGKATVNVIYPQSEALWSRVRLVATTSNNGTEYVESVEFNLPILAGDVGSCDESVPNHYSPYGLDDVCNSRY